MVVCRPGDRRKILGARVIAAGVEADRVLEAGLAEAQRVGPLVHHRDEALDALAAEVLGQSVGGVGTASGTVSEAVSPALLEPGVTRVRPQRQHEQQRG